MVEDTNERSVRRTSRGVNVRPVAIHTDSTTDTDTVTTYRTGTRSVVHVRNEIQTTLDLMGPSTPTLSQSYNAPSDADNEESLSTIPEQHSSVMNTSKDTYFTPTHHVKITSDSVKADIATSSSCTELQSAGFRDNSPGYEYLEYPQPQVPHFCLNPDCMCMMGYMNQTTIPIVPERVCSQVCTTKSIKSLKEDNKKEGLISWLKNRSFEMLSRRQDCAPCELYRFNVAKKNRDKEGPPRRLVFDLVEGIPTVQNSSVSTIKVKNPIDRRKSNFTGSKGHSRKSTIKETKDEKIVRDTDYETIDVGHEEDNGPQKHIHYDSQGDTRVDFYYFDHGNAQYFHTTDTPPVMICEILAEKTERYTTRFWAEFFTTVHIGVAFVVSFILQFFKFLLYSIFRPLTVGLMQLGSDYFFKPCLTTFFNGIVQPVLIFFYNVATSLRDLCDPIAEGLGYFCRELAVLCRSIRLFSITKCGKNGDCKCDKKYKCGS